MQGRLITVIIPLIRRVIVVSVLTTLLLDKKRS